MNQAFLLKKQFQQMLNAIPKENRAKFYNDLIKLAAIAQKGNYDNFDLGE